MSVPIWVQDSIFYQIFPDRFANGSKDNDPQNLMPWGSKPTMQGFQGGDLRGIIDRMYYLLDLGVTAIYMNPIFLSTSNHRYNTSDYFQIDPKLGTRTDFDVLLDVAHRNQMKIILDGVFNHCGRGFYAFNDILENQSASPYVDWFHINSFPVDAFSPGEATSYQAWWNHKSLPKLNTSNTKVREYIMRVAKYWTEQGIDGWRLDVPNEIDDDSFWSEFRHIVKSVNPEAYLVGEIWDGDPRWVGGYHFDGLMNYTQRKMILDLVSEQTDAAVFTTGMEDHLKHYPVENIYAMYSLLGSHDTERVLTVLDGNMQRTKLAYQLLMTLPGAPAIYYGDEIGLSGGGDPDCRKAFPWDESQWNEELRAWVKNLIKIRKDYAVLRRGDIKFQRLENPDMVVYTRQYDREYCNIILNTSEKRSEVGWTIPEEWQLSEASFLNVQTMEPIYIDENRISLFLDSQSGAVLINTPGAE